MRQNPLHIVALVVCLNGLFTTVVRAENEASKTGSLHWTPQRDQDLLAGSLRRKPHA